MPALLRLLLAVAYLAAAALPCAGPDESAPAPELMRAYASAALHAHGAAPESPDGELRAPCACGCDETLAGRLVSTPLGAALVPAQGTPDLPRVTHLGAPPVPVHETAGQPSEPVPRLA
jgi:hypothetical protein